MVLLEHGCEWGLATPAPRLVVADARQQLLFEGRSPVLGTLGARSACGIGGQQQAGCAFLRIAAGNSPPPHASRSRYRTNPSGGSCLEGVTSMVAYPLSQAWSR